MVMAAIHLLANYMTHFRDDPVKGLLILFSSGISLVELTLVQ
jgi:hypothetical protein